MAVRRGRRVSFVSPAKNSFDRRGRVTTLTPGISRSTIGRIVGGAEQQRLVAAAPVEQAIGEDVAALEIGGELDLVERDEGHVEVARHRLDGGDPVARLVGLDLLLAGDQRDMLGADALDDLVVDLARQQAQRQADDAGAVAEHALDGEMRLAGVGRPENRGDAAGTHRGGQDGRQHGSSGLGDVSRVERKSRNEPHYGLWRGAR